MRCFIRATLAVAALYAIGGCYTFSSLQGNPAVGTDVRATMTDEEALRVGRQTGELSRFIDGRLVGVSSDSVVVSVVTLRAVSEVAGSRQLRQTVVIRRSGLEELASRDLSIWRSGLLGVVGGAVVAAVIHEVATGGTNDPGENPDVPTTTLVPILRIPVGR